MNLLGAVSYDPAGGAVSKATSALLAMTALDTANLRVAVTIPAHGKIYWRIMGCLSGATTLPSILVGLMNGATVVGRASPQYFTGTQNLATQNPAFVAEGYASGLTPGAMNLDAAYAVQVLVAATNIKYGGPNTNAGANAWGAFTLEVWDPQPITPAQQLLVDANGRVDLAKVAGTAQTARDLGLALPAAAPGAAGGLLIDDVWTDARAAKLDNLDAAVSSRAAAATAVSNADYTAARAVKIDNLDVAVSTRNATAPLDAAGTRTAVGMATANLDTQLAALDADILTRAAPGAAMALTAGERTSVADALLNRNVAGGSSAGRLVKESLAFLRNKWTLAGSTLTVYDADDVTVLWTAQVARTAGDPISSSDPA